MSLPTVSRSGICLHSEKSKMNEEVESLLSERVCNLLLTGKVISITQQKKTSLFYTISPHFESACLYMYNGDKFGRVHQFFSQDRKLSATTSKWNPNLKWAYQFWECTLNHIIHRDLNRFKSCKTDRRLLIYWPDSWWSSLLCLLFCHCSSHSELCHGKMCPKIFVIHS